MRVIRTTMPDGSKWDVPAKVIADNRASFYSSDGETSYKEEFNYTMSSAYELIDWGCGKMNWEDVEKHATKVENPVPDMDFQEGWVNGDKEVVDLHE